MQSDTQSWPVDAAWSKDGMVCRNHTRAGSGPSCFASKPVDTSCSVWRTGAIIADEYP